MNEVPRQLDQTPDTTTQPSTETTTEAKAEKAKQHETPDKSINRGGGWKGLLRKLGIRGAAATAVVGIGVGATEASAVEKPTTSTSQEDTTEKTDDGITEKNGHVVKVDRDRDNFNITKVDKDTIVVRGEEDTAVIDGAGYTYSASNSLSDGEKEVAGVGMDIKNVEKFDTPEGQNSGAIINVDDSKKLDRFKHISDDSIEEGGHIVRINKPHKYDMGKVDDNTIIIKGEVGPFEEKDHTPNDQAKKGIKDLQKAGIKVKETTVINIPVDFEDSSKSVIKVEVDDANKLDNMK